MCTQQGTHAQAAAAVSAWSTSLPRETHPILVPDREVAPGQVELLLQALEPVLRKLLVIDVHAVWVPDARLAAYGVEVNPGPCATVGG